MAYQKQISRTAKITEIRIRELSPEAVQQIGKIALVFRESRASVIVERLIKNYLSDQESIKQLQQRNSDLHRAIQKYYDKESSMLEIVQEIAANASRSAAEAKAMQKYFTRSKPKAKKVTKKK